MNKKNVKSYHLTKTKCIQSTFMLQDVVQVTRLPVIWPFENIFDEKTKKLKQKLIIHFERKKKTKIQL